MIGSINAIGKYVNTSTTPSYPYFNNSGIGVGNLRLVSGVLEVYDGISWNRAPGANSTVGLTLEAESLLDWAKKKRDEEIALERMAETNVTIAGLIREKKDLEDKIKMVQILTKEEPKLGTS